MQHVGERGSVREVLQSPDCDPLLKEALAELMVFTTDVVGTDGARARLRHEQNGFGLAYDPSSGFLTPNFTYVRSPLVVLLHGGGVQERYEVNLLEECPNMPCAREMLQLVAEDPVAQARFFILFIRLFCEHVLGSGPMDEFLRHNGWLEGTTFPDGFAASGLGCAFGMLAAFHGPIEEQARLSLHPHMPILGGVQERYEVNLLEECPNMPCAREMLQLVAEDPVAQARFFILFIRLFCEHVLGSGPMDEFLRHNGWLEGTTFPDGFAASGLGCAFGMLAAFHGPIEEQARLSLHPHMPIWMIGTTSEAWLRSILRREAKEAQEVLRRWQESALAAVQSMQLDSAAGLPLASVWGPSTRASAAANALHRASAEGVPP